ncbi:MGMT family protein [candidate division TA06 bacterium]|uniref:MGMT family protein n=1 Tax=candidate division TA06 bacterium TaxID=2250710 RepID=A0A933MJ21_UNCT6|nr:MGMT family protein [candidate division TA06 bacterium]
MTFSSQIISLIKRIPRGKVASYGQIAALAGNPRGARAVIWLLHSSSGKEKLPWHRVINGQGTISLKPGNGYEEQRALLESEGVEFGLQGKIDLKRYLWPGPPAKQGRRKQ